MNSWPTLDRAPLELPLLPGFGDALWATLVELADLRSGDWTLIGAQMVLLHAVDHGATPPRISADIDALVNVRVATGGVADFVTAIEDRGFELAGASPDGIAHRYVRSDVAIDVLAPEGLGSRADLTTTPPGRTLEVPGGTQALNRTELLPVSFGSGDGVVPRPSLLGAIVCKAVAVDVDESPTNQRIDLALLLSLVRAPIALAGELSSKDRKRLRGRPELRDAEHPAWLELPQDQADRGRAALALLVR